MLKRPWFAYLTGLLALLILAANLYVFFTREWESSFYPASYATIYYPLDVPTIRNWTVVARDSLQLNLVCNTTVTEWKVLTDGGKEQRAWGMHPVFKIDTTHSVLHSYRFVPVPEYICPAIEVSVRCFFKEFYASLGMQHDDVYIVRANVPCGEFEQYAVADWVDDYTYAGEKNLVDAQRILKDDMGILRSEPTFAKMEKLLPFLRKKLQGTGGVPKDDERWMDPFTLYTELVAGTAKGWCTQNAQVFVFWANQAGIPTRFVFGARTENNTIVYTGHSFAECFIKEQSRWAFVDLQASQIYITDKQGEVLNSAELFHLNQHNAFDSTFARIYVDQRWEKLPGVPRTDTVMTVPFVLCNSNVREEFTAHSILKYRRPPNVEDVRDIYTGFYKDWTFLKGNLERYLFKPPLAYSFYPTEGAHTYMVRRVLFFALLASLLLWLGAVMMARAKRKRTEKAAA
jgi:hypothetical protein